MQEIFLGLLFLSRTCIRRHQFFNFRCRNDVVWCFFVFHNDNAVWGNNVLSVRAVGGVMVGDVEHRETEYNPDQYLWEKEFTLTGRTYQRQDLEATQGHQGLYLEVESLSSFSFP
ncbi:hypothetical protein D0Y65_003878 [Glycine soja]|uniref:Uncharacterized protein n=1 Tax=Glycine soja TaxID=3848 RepID=A0A445LNP7_GLYSO|nr:hypothetical protein D0Y65_003878 [Glycine soja]